LTATGAVGCDPAFEPGLGFTAGVASSEPCAQGRSRPAVITNRTTRPRDVRGGFSSQPGFNPLAPQTPVSGSDASERVAPWWKEAGVPPPARWCGAARVAVAQETKCGASQRPPSWWVVGRSVAPRVRSGVRCSPVCSSGVSVSVPLLLGAALRSALARFRVYCGCRNRLRWDAPEPSGRYPVSLSKNAEVLFSP